MIGVIGGNAYLGGIMDLLVGALADLALVRDGEVEDGEEGTSLEAVSPMPVPSAFVPDFTLFHEVVIFLRICWCSSIRVHGGRRGTS